jgi:flagellar biosynthetic protein FlhB
MSEDRSQAPSKRRREEARRRGQAARSPELTSAAGLLAAIVALGVWGGDLGDGMLSLIRDSFATPPIRMEISSVVDSFQSAAAIVFVPLASILASVVVAAVAAHQVQVGGLFVPSLLAPDLSRLWNGGFFAGFAGRAGRGLAALGKVALLGILAFWLVRYNLIRFEHLMAVGCPDMTAQASLIVFGILRTIAVVLLALGVVDFWLQWRRFEAMLRMTPDQHREELRSLDGDPALRAKRRRIANSWRGGSEELLVGATIGLSARGGLIVLIGGGPPPRGINVRHVARGASAGVLRRQLERAGIAIIEAPDVARALARGRGAGSSLSAEHAEELAAIWPKSVVD